MGAAAGKHWLTSDDFMASEKYEFSPKVCPLFFLASFILFPARLSALTSLLLFNRTQQGGPRTPAHQLSHTFKFKDYSPMAFAYLRRMFGVNEYDFLLSVCGNANFIEFISNAKSGQFFFYSSDGKYMIKTMTNVESKFLRRSKSNQSLESFEPCVAPTCMLTILTLSSVQFFLIISDIAQRIPTPY
jgi:1-phosphatidylinositol-4-phosphate 5-kinase